ncbi:DUF3054 domain-containing protein [Lysinibacter sp. HNR]|uniref:DUF3054 domain-containing protein n=1 Tax=Lysinibacter sp. HNR TaxID=3031408 RepID=UPI002435C0A2|nr:DUF3054 domain-containing protein [Lysinibacter sp. HNR]WGD36888.1 DUF3054 domain-containing protein [Lysinibacter sp. HNR]
MHTSSAARSRAHSDGAVRPRTSPRVIILALLLDILCVVIFVMIGRRNHEAGVFTLGTLNAVWPFATGLIVGWVAVRAWRFPTRVVSPGIPVWIATIVVGMLLRVVSDQGVQLSFVIVGALFTALFLLGWRSIWSVIGLLASRKNRS